MSITTQTNIELSDPLRLMRRLCRHWSHKLEVEFDDQSGHTIFDHGTAYYTVFPECLSVHLKADDMENLEELKAVLDRHLIRMALPEEITITWI